MTFKIISIVILLMNMAFIAHAAEPVATKSEIAHLFTTLEASTCQFNRNGSWYNAKEAASHLNTKYKYLQDKDMVPTAEKFIERAATGSSLSGKAYLIKCADAVVQPSGPWFQAVLEKYRVAPKSKYMLYIQ